MPNADTDGRVLFDQVKAFAARRPNVGVFTSLGQVRYLSCLAQVQGVVGNSSSGIIEAPLLGVPAVNAGDRQRGRTRGDNVIEVEFDAGRVASAIVRAADPGFRAGLSHTSPYGDGHAAARIVDAILRQPIDDRLLMKEVAA
jgi:GDP/UDP-N,N'-diacetylbacillosamine 2-epimerase (hydrolysing)